MIHYTAMPDAGKVCNWLCNPESNVSAHYVIARDGTCWHLVREDMRAWHAGPGAWGSVREVNSRSIGIELVNTGAEPFPEPLMAVLERLLRGIMERWDIPPERVIGHSDLALGRKIDPGPRFDWARLARQGLAVSGTETDHASDFLKDARRAGYAADEASADALLTAFRERFRPGAKGPLDETDRRLMAGLAARHPAL